MTTIFFLQSISWLHSDVTPRNSHPPLFGTERGTWPSKRSHVPTFVMQWKHTRRSVLLCAEVKAWLWNGGLISNACFGAARLLRAKCQGGKDLLWCWLTSDVAQRQRKALPNYSKENKFIVLVFQAESSVEKCVISSLKFWFRFSITHHYQDSELRSCSLWLLTYHGLQISKTCFLYESGTLMTRVKL